MHLSTILPAILAVILGVSPSLTSPLPALTSSSLGLFPRDGAHAPQASDIIAAIMPTSTSCASAASGGKYASDCRTAAQAAEPLITAMATYNLTSAGQIAAVLALVGVESADLKYKHNVSPGLPGQGTSAMLMPDNVAKYTASIPELAGGVAAAGGDAVKVLELVVEDDRYNFGAAAWWLTSQCDAQVVAGLADASDAAWAAYMACVGVSATDEARLAYWGRAKKAFGLA